MCIKINILGLNVFSPRELFSYVTYLEFPLSVSNPYNKFINNVVCLVNKNEVLTAL